MSRVTYPVFFHKALSRGPVPISIDFFLNPFCIKLVTIHFSACNFCYCVFIQRNKV